MDRLSILKIYDDDYAALYDQNFLLGENFCEATGYELALIEQLLDEKKTWLDLGCGTGYVLSRFPHIDRCGLDISPAMLERAIRANPNASFVQGDFRDAVEAWEDRWDLVSCMWYAYCYLESVEAVESLIRNMAAWTRPGGAAFVPICDPNVLTKTTIPYEPPADSTDGRLCITGVVWDWIDEPIGREHRGLVAPTLGHMEHIFRRHFAVTEIVNYPAFERDCLENRKAIIARKAPMDQVA